MTKRFQLFKHKNEEYILDEPNTYLDFIEMLGDALSFEEIVDLLNVFNEENDQLKKENNELKGNIINSLKKSRTVKCNCNPCVAEETVIEMLMESKK